MRRREFIAGLGSGLGTGLGTGLGAAASAVLWPLAARAQQGVRVRRIGILRLTNNFVETSADAIKKGLAGLGWTEGRNTRFEEPRFDNADQLLFYAAELARLAPDAIFVLGSSALQAMRHATSDIPIVFAVVADPVGQGFVSSLARPGGNITGFALFEFGLSSKRLDLLKKLAPTIDSVAYMFDPLNPAAVGVWAEIEAAAPLLALSALKIPVRTADEIERAIAALARQPNGGLYVGPSQTTLLHAELIPTLAMRYRLPSVYDYRFFVESGGLASYGADPIDLSRRAASYVDRILKGEKPRDLPVQLPTRFEFVLNLKTAKAIGLDISPNVLALADDVID
jgi:putative ABC transport system substrate-binding protein